MRVFVPLQTTKRSQNIQALLFSPCFGHHTESCGGNVRGWVSTETCRWSAKRERKCTDWRRRGVCVDLPSSKLRFFYKTVLTCLLCWSLLSLACQMFERHEVWSTLQLGPEPPTTTHYSVQEGIVWLTICCVFKCHLVVVLSKIVYATIIDLHEKRVIIIMLWQTQFGQTTYNMCRHCNQSVCCSVCWLWISSLRTITCLRLKIWCH